MRGPGRKCSAGYHLLASPATPQGQGGVQLWVKQVWSLKKSRIRLQEHHLRILRGNSHQLAVHLRRPAIELIVLVLHAPNNAEDKTFQDWWKNCSALVPARLLHVPRRVFVDANARVGSITSKSIGSLGEETENEAGYHFRQWLSDEGLTVPQTFPAIGKAPATTWAHSSGSESRIDYVAVDACLVAAVLSAARADLDLTIQSQDHYAAQLTADLATTRPISQPSTAKAAAEKQSLGYVPWHVDVRVHAEHAHQWLQSSNEQAKQHLPRKKHLSAETWQMIRLKHFHWKRFAAIRRAKHRGILRAVFSAMRQVKRTTSKTVRVEEAQDWLRACDFGDALHWFRYSNLCLQTSWAVRQDDLAFYRCFANHG